MRITRFRTNSCHREGFELIQARETEESFQRNTGKFLKSRWSSTCFVSFARKTAAVSSSRGIISLLTGATRVSEKTNVMRGSESVSSTLRKTTAAIATWDASEHPWMFWSILGTSLEFFERPSHRGTERDDSWESSSRKVVQYWVVWGETGASHPSSSIHKLCLSNDRRQKP